MTAAPLPPLVIASAASTAIEAVAVSGLVSPVPPGTVLYNCTVLPATWTGTVSLVAVGPNPQASGDVVLGPITGNTFTIIVGATPLVGGTFRGTLTVSP